MWAETEDVWDDISCASVAPSRFHAHPHLHVRLTLSIRVLFWILSKALYSFDDSEYSASAHEQTRWTNLVNDEVFKWYLLFSDFGTDCPQIFVDGFNSNLCCLSGQDLTQNITRRHHAHISLLYLFNYKI